MYIHNTEAYRKMLWGKIVKIGDGDGDHHSP
jgi:hypothetical protein